MNTRYCKHCKSEHPLTSEFWKRLNSRPTSPQCRNRVNETRKLWVDKNRNYMKQKTAESYKRHKEKVIQRNYEYTKRKRKEDVNFNLMIVLRQRFSKAIKGQYKSGSAVKDLGCSVEEFKVYLQNKFSPGMTWDNYGRDGWHIDHIIPLSSFNLQNSEQVKQALHFTNLQPLWAEDNLKKNNKLIGDSARAGHN